ncbi:MAG: hypothetical protein PHZ19_09990 [Candidatus Thermoplasmatota archaeon]|nr:hypothetical protein [Candidatus Thermoplasmatota archaeon]
MSIERRGGWWMEAVDEEGFDMKLTDGDREHIADMVRQGHKSGGLYR